MLTLAGRAALRRAILDPTIDPHVRALLRLRFEQLGGTGADFHLIQPSDRIGDAEEAVGWPMIDEGIPCWEWMKVHPGNIIELTFVLSDDGPAQVLVVPGDACPAVLDLIHAHA